MTNPSYSNWFNLALEAFTDAKYAKALYAISQYLLHFPDDEEARLAKATILISLSNLSEARTLLDQISLKDKPERFQAIYYTELGNLHQAVPDFKKAAEAFQKVIDLEPDQSNGYILKGSVFAQSGDYEGARPLYQYATRLEGDPDEAWLNLGLLYRAQLKLEEAKEALEMALSLEPNYEEASFALEDVMEALELKKG